MTPTREYPVVTFEEFPHGLRCILCRRVIDLGFPYGGSVIGFSDGGEPVYELTCTYCPDGEEHERQ